VDRRRSLARFFGSPSSSINRERAASAPKAANCIANRARARDKFTRRGQVLPRGSLGVAIHPSRGCSLRPLADYRVNINFTPREIASPRAIVFARSRETRAVFSCTSDILASVKTTFSLSLISFLLSFQRRLEKLHSMLRFISRVDRDPLFRLRSKGTRFALD